MANAGKKTSRSRAVTKACWCDAKTMYLVGHRSRRKRTFARVGLTAA